MLLCFFSQSQDILRTILRYLIHRLGHLLGIISVKRDRSYSTNGHSRNYYIEFPKHIVDNFISYGGVYWDIFWDLSPRFFW